jgi:hypothetical protein
MSALCPTVTVQPNNPGSWDLPTRDLPTRWPFRAVESGQSPAAQPMTVTVKGFRMPARRRREGMHGGRRPKSLEGGNRGGVRIGGGVRLWRFSADV